MKDFLTDEAIEREIARLNATDEVKLAEKEIRLRYARRKRLYNLRCLEKRGRELMEAGITLENIEEMMEAAQEERDERAERD